jgi:ribosomal protein S18 acetylase RimI-like enzyme
MLSIRPVAETDDLSGLYPVWGAPLEPTGAGVVVLGDGLAVGLAVTVPAAPGVRVEQLHVGAGVSAGEVLSAVADASAAAGRIELYARDAPDLLDEVAAEAGFELAYRQGRVGRSLAELYRPANRPFTFRRWSEVGRRGLLTMLAGIWEGGDGPNRLPAELELERLEDVARPGPSEPPDMSLWRVAYYAGEPAGVALVIDAGGGLGTLAYIGLLPELRGRGLGRALHAEALWLMRSSGLARYEDGTGVDNGAMRAILEDAGCQPIGSAVMFARDPERAAAQREPGDAGTRPAGAVPLGSHVSLLRKVQVRHEVSR